MEKTPISPETRLLIASRILAGMQAPGYVADTVETMAEIRGSAIEQTDRLIEACDCVVMQPPPVYQSPVIEDFMSGEPVFFKELYGPSSHIFLSTSPDLQEPVNDASGH